MPKQSPSQTIGREGEKWFEAQLPPSWIPQRPTEDVGVDALVVICEDNALNGLEFRVQIKSTRVWRTQDRNILLKFARQSLLDLILGFTPALLVTYETNSKQGYCFWINQLVGKDLSLLSPHRKSLTLSIPMTRPVIADLWPRLGQEVRGLSAAVGKRVALAGRSFPILTFVHAMSKALRNFDSVAHHWAASEVKSDEQIAVLHGLEVSCHRDVVLAINDLRESLPTEFNPIVGLDDFAHYWMQSCESFISEFQELVQDPGLDLSDRMMSVKVNHDRMAEKRIGFVRSILDAQVQITKLGAGLREEDEADATETQNNDLRGSVWALASRARGLPKRINIVRLTVIDLGFPEGATTKEIIGADDDMDQHGRSAPFSRGRGVQIGLELCPAEVGPSYRLEYKDQPQNERLYVAMKPIRSSDGEPRIFVLEHKADGMSLDAARARPDDKWRATDIFMFCTGHEVSQDYQVQKT
jgi:hypothetical protein